MAISANQKMDITIESTSKNYSRTYITPMCLLGLPYMVTLITKWTSSLNSHQKLIQNIYNTYVFAGIAIYGYSHHKTDITIEFISKTDPGHIKHDLYPLDPNHIAPISQR